MTAISTIKTLGLVHKAMERAAKLKTENPRKAHRLMNAAESVLSILVFQLRHPVVRIPTALLPKIELLKGEDDERELTGASQGAA